ncbi:hypothetical protein BU14_0105s0024 [Porphyra umbilicalis]|uniref:Uncharacterized protein n=1 Tax=Porphyra umbilicalis TaxID=2786 RepID=A0A1X6PCZ5_PORUM|nr:hypothetical protein BU14_0105s0024 [Porphyra umbilicalis]|eukprot:OSX78606.1 hypothetical protein BU14_0105s0024 [Porphyra umbilicalis]
MRAGAIRVVSHHPIGVTSSSNLGLSGAQLSLLPLAPMLLFSLFVLRPDRSLSIPPHSSLPVADTSPPPHAGLAAVRARPTFSTASQVAVARRGSRWEVRAARLVPQG